MYAFNKNENVGYKHPSTYDLLTFNTNNNEND